MASHDVAPNTTLQYGVDRLVCNPKLGSDSRRRDTSGFHLSGKSDRIGSHLGHRVAVANVFWRGARGAMRFTVSGVFGDSPPRQIEKRVIAWIPVKVAALVAKRSWPDKSAQHEFVDVGGSFVAISAKLHADVAVFMPHAAKDSRWHILSATPANGLQTAKAADSAKVRNFVVGGKAADGLPRFVHNGPLYEANL